MHDHPTQQPTAPAVGLRPPCVAGLFWGSFFPAHSGIGPHDPPPAEPARAVSTVIDTGVLGRSDGSPGGCRHRRGDPPPHGHHRVAALVDTHSRILLERRASLARIWRREKRLIGSLHLRRWINHRSELRYHHAQAGLPVHQLSSRTTGSVDIRILASAPDRPVNGQLPVDKIAISELALT